MFSKVLLLFSLFAAVVVAAPAVYKNDESTPIIVLNSNVSCTSAVSPGNINASPSPSVILLNNPSPTQSSSYNSHAGNAVAPQASGSPPVILLNNPSPTQSSSYNSGSGYDAAPQDSGSPSVIVLNAPAPSPSVIKLNKRQFSSSPSASTFSFGGIVPSSSATSTTSSSQSFSFGGIVTPSSSAPVITAAPSSSVANGQSIFTSKGADGVVTVLLLSTLTVTGDACSTTPPSNPALALNSSSAVAESSAFPFSVFSSSLPIPTSSPLGANVQASLPTSSPSLSIINLNTPAPAAPTV